MYADLINNTVFFPDFTPFSVWKAQRVYEKENEHWRDDTEIGNQKFSEKSLIRCHLARYKPPHMY